MLISIFRALCAAALSVSVLAVPPPNKVENAPRSYMSGSTICYYSCPSVSGYTFSSVTTSGSTASCSYTKNGFGGGIVCRYDSTTGAMGTSSSPCPNGSLTAKCGGTKTSSSFKRDLIGGDDKRKRIRSLQWTPEKAKARAAELKAKQALQARRIQARYLEFDVEIDEEDLD